MNISVEISYYPLTNSFENPINEFIEEISLNKKITFEVGQMSTIISGNYHDVMQLISSTIENMMAKYPSVFNLKISNACELKTHPKNQ